MGDYRKLFNSPWFTAADIPEGETVTGTIETITVETVKSTTGESDLPCVHFKQKGIKPLVLNKTNATTIADKFGNNTDAVSYTHLTLPTICSV